MLQECAIRQHWHTYRWTAGIRRRGRRAKEIADWFLNVYIYVFISLWGTRSEAAARGGGVMSLNLGVFGVTWPRIGQMCKNMQGLAAILTKSTFCGVQVEISTKNANCQFNFHKTYRHTDVLRWANANLSQPRQHLHPSEVAEELLPLLVANASEDEEERGTSSNHMLPDIFGIVHCRTERVDLNLGLANETLMTSLMTFQHGIYGFHMSV